jgi:acetyl-CoA acetyltransferase
MERRCASHADRSPFRRYRIRCGRETLKRSGLAADKVQTMVMGNVTQAGVKLNPARQAGIGAGLPID